LAGFWVRYAWARPSIEDCIKAASERRLCFLDSEREVLDDLVTAFRTAQVSQIIGFWLGSGLMVYG
jgi:hypothetical protein